MSWSRVQHYPELRLVDPYFQVLSHKRALVGTSWNKDAGWTYLNINSRTSTKQTAGLSMLILFFRVPLRFCRPFLGF